MHAVGKCIGRENMAHQPVFGPELLQHLLRVEVLGVVLVCWVLLHQKGLMVEDCLRDSIAFKVLQIVQDQRADSCTDD